MEKKGVKQFNNLRVDDLKKCERVLMGSNSNHLQTTTLSPFWEFPQLSLSLSLWSLHCSILVLFSGTFCDVFLLLPRNPPSLIPLAQREKETEWKEGIKRGTDRKDVRDREVTEMKVKCERLTKPIASSAKLIDKWGNRCLVLCEITPAAKCGTATCPHSAALHYIPKSDDGVTHVFSICLLQQIIRYTSDNFKPKLPCFILVRRFQQIEILQMSFASHFYSFLQNLI